MTLSWTQLAGHSEIRDRFRRCIAAGRLSHAWVFTGPDGVGKQLFARLMAKSLFCRERAAEDLDCCGECRACRSFDAATWPDYYEIGRPQGKSEIPLSLLIGEADKRGREGLCHHLSMSPRASLQRIAVINDAQSLNEEGANAILKTLEEPTSHALILLICDNAESLLPTIRSRCQIVRFGPLSDADVADILIRNEFVDDARTAAEIAALAEGSVSQARQLLNPELRELRQLLAAQLAQLEGMQPFVIAKQLAERLDAVSSGTEECRRNAQWLLRFLAQFIHQRVRSLASGDLSDPLTRRWGLRQGVDVLTPILQHITTASRRLESYSPVPLVLESLFDEVARQLRRAPTGPGI